MSQTVNGVKSVNGGSGHDLAYAEKLNPDPQRLKFA